jgi:hypothetical protein
MEIIFILVLSLATGYQAGKAGQKQIAIENKGYCVLKTLDGHEECYQVKKVEDEKLAQAIKIKED